MQCLQMGTTVFQLVTFFFLYATYGKRFDTIRQHLSSHLPFTSILFFFNLEKPLTCYH